MISSSKIDFSLVDLTWNEPTLSTIIDLQGWCLGEETPEGAISAGKTEVIKGRMEEGGGQLEDEEAFWVQEEGNIEEEEGLVEIVQEDPWTGEWVEFKVPREYSGRDESIGSHLVGEKLRTEKDKKSPRLDNNERPREEVKDVQRVQGNPVRPVHSGQG